MASLSTANVGGSESGSSSRDVSPIEDINRPLQNQFQVHGQPTNSITPPDKVETAHPPVASLAHAGGRRAYSPNQNSSVTTSRLQDDITRTDTSSKVNSPSSTIRGAGVARSIPRLMRDSIRPVATLASQRGGQDHDPKEIWTDASSQNTTKIEDSRSQGVRPLCPVGNQIIQVGSDRQIPSTDSPNRGLESTSQVDRTQTQITPSFNNVITPAEGVRSPRSSSPEIAKPAPLTTYSRKGISQPRYSNDKEGNNYNPRLWPAVKTDVNRRGKSATAPAQDGLSHAKWNRSHFGDQPSSRFSDTSCSTAANDSPPSTPEQKFERRIGTPALSILSRKRPVQLANVHSPDIPRRKPTPSEVQKSIGLNNENQGNYKPLPKSPPEAQAVTRVASLEAKLEALRRRRANLQTVVHELTNVAMRSPIAYDMASRQKMKQTIDGLGKELSEVGKEEHETGLQLHRAWKREEQTSTYENSSLWVKRLAS